MSSFAMDKKKVHTTPEYDTALSLRESNPLEAAEMLKKIIQTTYEDEEEASKMSRMKEEAIYELGRLYAKAGDVSNVQQLMVDIRPFFKEISKPRSAKIVRTLIDDIATMPNSASFLISLCKDSIEWCRQEKRSFLRQRLEARLAALYSAEGQYKLALATIRKVAKEVKKFDDKPLMVELELIESHVYYALQNIPKAKGALTAARSNANSFYCPPLTLAEIDMQAGVLCAAEKDFKTGFSYFYEAYEGFSSNGKDADAVKALKYMMLCKVMANQAADVYNIINSKAGTKYAGPAAAAVKAVADAHRARSLAQLEQALAEHRQELSEDPVVGEHVATLRDQLLDSNLARVIAPYTRVGMQHVAARVGLDVAVVEARVSRMILDGVLHAVVDQDSGDLIVLPKEPEDKLHTAALALVHEMGGVLNKLQERADDLTRQY